MQVFSKMSVITISVIVFLLGILFFALHPDRKLEAQTIQWTGQENHSISLADASSLTKNFRVSSAAGTILGEYFGRDAILGILKEPNCVGIRIYYGKKSDGTPALVIVGVDANEGDITSGSLAEQGLPCPPFCDLNSPLSH